jgi:hypothetical protein
MKDIALKFVVNTVVGVIALLFSSYVLVQIWGWFILGFLDLPALPFAVAVGARFLLTSFMGNHLFPVLMALEWLENKYEWIKGWTQSVSAVATIGVHFALWFGAWIWNLILN